MPPWCSNGYGGRTQRWTRNCASRYSRKGRLPATITIDEEKMAITRDSLLTLEAYAKARPALRAEVIRHKKQRTVHLGNHLSLLFEDEMTRRGRGRGGGRGGGGGGGGGGRAGRDAGN